MNRAWQHLAFIALSFAISWGFSLAWAADGAEAEKENASKDPSSPAETPKFVDLTIYPSEIHLNHAAAKQQAIAVARRTDGISVDVTSLVEWKCKADNAAEPLAKWADGRVQPLRDGNTTLVARLDQPSLDQTNSDSLSASVPVYVQGATINKEVSFRHDVMPIFLRAGCNAGGCHGSSRGKDGFQLSLFGYDPAGDYFRLTRERATRRLNRALPDDSLLLEKCIGAVPHTGGKRFEKESEYYSTLHNWVSAGAPSDLADAPTVESLQLYPPEATMELDDAQQFVALATYSDGNVRDVTDLALFLSSDSTVASIDPQGRCVAGVRGEAFVMARFDTHTVGSPVLTLPTESIYQPTETPPANYIDELVDAKLNTLRIPPSERSSDAEFLRRVTIDLAGRLPEVAELEAFLANEAPDKRALAIDRLIDTPEFRKLWTLHWANLLMVRSENNRVDYKAMQLYFEWIAEQIQQNRPLDEFVHELLTASGPTFVAPAGNFYQVEPLAAKTAENVAQAFLGIRVQCAQCHNHPFDRWTMEDYYGFAAFFSQVGRKPGEDYREMIVFDRGFGETNHPVDGKPRPPQTLGGEPTELAKENRVDRRKVAADWITSPENPYFATNLGNRFWAHFFGVGIVEPVDDVRVSNPPSNQALYDALGSKLIEYDFDFTRLVRDICNSNAYQRASSTTEANQHDRRNFAYARTRRIPAEVLLDCVSQATGAEEKLPGLPLGARATQVADGKANHYFLKTFGRSKRDTVCACEARAEPTLSQALHLMNGATVHGKINQGKLIESMLEEGAQPQEVARRLYLRCLSREPSDAELAALDKLIAEDPKPRDELQDVFWALLNSREFLFNH
ncbi:DUF1549 and DUF1553 domain-containing protein [Adhaeretor mobilis]|uniref:Uncharacterized protein n=1 Tax=Adhaeretor mobilis TaxID=1930276 RepID=A0A517MZJ2_9BACT|nr:DUF1549 and DUF1553 domain-containing protein [Adhaeretor mobilis]QDT00300.1 hypothetical protein HG15A2_36360 [Adhaeretor mobilis]